MVRIALCYNVKPPQAAGSSQELDFDAPETIAGLGKTIADLGHQVSLIEADEQAYGRLKTSRRDIDLVFNIAEGLRGDARESQIPLFCEMLGLPYTHSSPTTHAVKLDKNLAKQVVSSLGVKVPGGVIVRPGQSADSYAKDLRFPLIIKPNCQGSSIGIYDANVVGDGPALVDRLDQLLQAGLGGDWLVEEYITGREFTVGILGNFPPRVLPIIEQRFDFLPLGMQRIAGYELKWVYEDRLTDISQAYVCPARITPAQRRGLEKTSLDIYEAIAVKDCARMDYRMTDRGQLYFLELNTLPGIIPDETVISYFPLAAKTAGIPYPQLIAAIIKNACLRWGL